MRRLFPIILRLMFSLAALLCIAIAAPFLFVLLFITSTGELRDG
jgi:hypothetical protein